MTGGAEVSGKGPHGQKKCQHLLDMVPHVVRLLAHFHHHIVYIRVCPSKPRVCGIELISQNQANSHGSKAVRLNRDNFVSNGRVLAKGLKEWLCWQLGRRDRPIAASDGSRVAGIFLSDLHHATKKRIFAIYPPASRMCTHAPRSLCARYITPAELQATAVVLACCSSTHEKYKRSVVREG
jgi:hypothetical protein